ncbi:MAG: UDP-N-acetylmuramate dehydrogenase [Planctomycetaceae bacterium]|nr:UDP-N-acetylmuramate dehydrogenase [Planctomycetaceae bacterium]MCA9046371.1 UDP-N-acetylmuramate dehydrogenase [Planctomycetaceae bacterium]MCB9954235.1 UDP-N-acetylmuramate dehydrogenase [Planctomycetaceae bacterium]
MSLLDQFSDITKSDEPMAQYTWLKVGGPAQWFIEPRNLDELEAVVRACFAEGIPVRLLGGGSNILIRDEGVSGAVIRLASDAFRRVSVEGTTVKAQGAAVLSNVISESVKAGLAGLETLVGIPGTIGGAVRNNAGGRHGEVGQFVKSVGVMTIAGDRFVRQGDELSFDYRFSSINELVITDVTLQLVAEDADEVARRMHKLWVLKKSTQPLSFQSAGCIFKNPRGLSAGSMIEQAGLKGTRVGKAEVSDRHGNFIVTYEGATAKDVLNLIDLVKARVNEVHSISLETEIQIW